MRFLKLCSWGTLILILASGPLMAQQAAAPVSVGEIYKRVSPAVVLIEELNSKREPIWLSLIHILPRAEKAESAKTG